MAYKDIKDVKVTEFENVGQTFEVTINDEKQGCYELYNTRKCPFNSNV